MCARSANIIIIIETDKGQRKIEMRENRYNFVCDSDNEIKEQKYVFFLVIVNASYEMNQCQLKESFLFRIRILDSVYWRFKSSARTFCFSFLFYYSVIGFFVYASCWFTRSFVLSILCGHLQRITYTQCMHECVKNIMFSIHTLYTDIVWYLFTLLTLLLNLYYIL